MMRDASKTKKTKILQDELILLNQHLPASVYIPFVGNSTRNNCVLHIPPEEARVFQTKERAPIMLCIEVFRPDEMSIVINQHKNQKLIKKLRRSRRGTGRADGMAGEQQAEWQRRQPDNPYLSVEAPEELQQSMDSSDMSSSLLGEEGHGKLKMHSSFVVSSEPTLVPATSMPGSTSNALQNFKMQSSRINKKIKKKFERQIEKQMDSMEQSFNRRADESVSRPMTIKTMK